MAMKTNWFLLLLAVFVQVFGPSMQIIVSPCAVETIETHPHFGTTLERKELVQIVQIPPVFTQTVIAGKCHNGSRDSSTSAMFGSYAVCTQRYSSVEVYIMKIADVPMFRQNYSVAGMTNSFRAGQFVKDFILVESGCDFTFNFIPLILEHHATAKSYRPTPTLSSATTQQRRPSSLTTPHHYYFLSSPYHKMPSEGHHYSPPAEQPTPTRETPQVPISDQTRPDDRIRYVEDVHSSAGPSPPNIMSHTSHSAGTHENGEEYAPQAQAQGGNIGYAASNHEPPNYYIPQAGDNTPSSVYVLRGEYPNQGESETRKDAAEPQLHGRGKGKDFDGSGDDEGNGSEFVPEYTATTPPKKEPDGFYNLPSELHGTPVKIGLPIYILSPEIDPLLKNIQSMQERHQQS